MKRSLQVYIVLLSLVGSISVASAGGQLVCGDKTMDLPEILRTGKTNWIPALTLFEAMGCIAAWNERSDKLLFTCEQKNGSIAPDFNRVLINGQLLPLDPAPRFVGGIFCVPESFISNVLFQAASTHCELNHISPVVPDTVVLHPTSALALRKIVIDPGHGGYDQGAPGPEGQKEKDIVLTVSLILRDMLEQNGIEVIMTRDADYYVTLADRTRIANASNADLYLAVHANGSYSKSSTGFETFFLSSEASDAQTAKLAQMENDAFATYDGDQNASNTSDLSAIISDMVRVENLKDSEMLAATIQKHLPEAMPLPNRGVKQAPFYVLMGSHIPAVLVEIGFMSNPEEAKKLSDMYIQQKIAYALTKAILSYDSVLEMKKTTSKSGLKSQPKAGAKIK